MDKLNEGINSINIKQEDFTLVLTRNNVSTILSVPHDGSSKFEYDGLFKQRPDNLTRVRDLNVWPIARDIFNNTNETSIVRGLLPRTLVDYNRAIDGRDYTFYSSSEQKIEPAYFDLGIAEFYKKYHESISKEIEAAIKRYSRNVTLLIDLHGFSRQPDYSTSMLGYDIILGTGNRRTIHYGYIDLNLSDFLSSRGYNVFCPSDMPIREGFEDDFDAGYITRYYSDLYFINCIQIEISSKLRGFDNLDKSIKLARDLSDFINNR